MRLLGWVLIQDDWAPYKRGMFRHKEGQTGVECPMEIKAEFRAMHSQTKECRRLPAARRKAQNSLHFSPQKETALPVPWSQTSGSNSTPSLETSMCHRFSPKKPKKKKERKNKYNVLRKIPRSGNIWSKFLNILTFLIHFARLQNFFPIYADF